MYEFLLQFNEVASDKHTVPTFINFIQGHTWRAFWFNDPPSQSSVTTQK
jgi:hypothetical protein